MRNLKILCNFAVQIKPTGIWAPDARSPGHVSEAWYPAQFPVPVKYCMTATSPHPASDPFAISSEQRLLSQLLLDEPTHLWVSQLL